MPSFVPDEESAIFSQALGIVHIDPAGQYGLFPEKDGEANGHIVRQPHPHTSNESLDKSSTQSTHTSEDSDVRSRPPPPNGAPPPPPTMNPPVNGGAVEGISSEAGHNGSASRKPLPNGISTALLGDRTPSSPYVTREGDSPALSAKETFPRSSFGSIQNSPVEMYLHPVNKNEIRTVDHAATPPHLRPPAGTAASSLSVGAPTPNADSSQRNAGSPHRYSSPPLYTGGALTPSSSGALQPPGAGLKHRHTLEVPKPTPSRGSRDGVDGTFASGRFSPTTAATSVRRASLSLARRNTRSLHSEMPRDEIVPDDDAQRWTEAYRQKRASRRKRREIEDDDRVLVGTKVDESHANWVTAYNMLTGIRVAVSRTNAKIDRNLTDADFYVKQKSTFDM
jgi:1-phosphatidylinositol-4-phosphate 5-kinase